MRRSLPDHRRRRADSRRARDNPVDVIGGIIDILRGAAKATTRRANGRRGCLLSGDCIEACDYGVNPRFLLHMARVAMVRAKNDAVTQRSNGVEGFRKVARDVNAYFALAARRRAAGAAGAGRNSAARAADGPPDFVFYTGCNVLKTPHIALLALDIMDALGVSYEVMGGPTHCCGMQPMRAGDPADLRPRRREHARQDGGEQDRAGGVVVPVLPRQFHRT